jgi:hypothetical protein
MSVARTTDVLAEILADARAPLHAQVRAAYDFNVERVRQDVDPSLDLYLPQFKYFMAAYATFGDDPSWYYLKWWLENQGTASSRAVYQGLPFALSACGDYDGDGVANVGEYYGQLGDPLLYVLAAMDAGTADDGGDPYGVCEAPMPFFGEYRFNHDPLTPTVTLTPPARSTVASLAVRPLKSSCPPPLVVRSRDPTVPKRARIAPPSVRTRSAVSFRPTADPLAPASIASSVMLGIVTFTVIPSVLE